MAGQGTPLREGQEQLLFDKDPLIFPHSRLHRGEDGDVPLPLPLFPEIVLNDLEADGGELRLKVGDQLREELAGGKKGDGHRPVSLRLLIRQFRLGICQFPKDAVGMP